MSLIYQHRIDRFGSKITYAYEENGYWDKDQKKYISKRRLIGRLDENGLIVPTGKGGRPRKEDSTCRDNSPSSSSSTEEMEEYKSRYLQVLQNLSNSEDRINDLTQQVAKLEKSLVRYQTLFSTIKENILSFKD